MIKRPLHKRLFYAGMRIVFRLTGTLLFQIRFFGEENFPESGGGLICANHQSNLDPPLVGMICERRINYLAKSSLFKFPLNIFIDLLDAIPIDRTGMGIAGIKETLRRAKNGEMILIFPEGQRTFDGEMNELMPGFVTVAKRTKVPLVPVGISGAFEAWPRTRPIPGCGTIYLVVHKPIQPEEFLHLPDEEIVILLEARIRACFEEAKQRRAGSFGK